MLRQFAYLILLTLVPALELRASIPYGIIGEAYTDSAATLPWPVVTVTCIVANAALGFLLYWAIGPAFQWLSRFKWVARYVDPVLHRVQRKVKPYVDRYGELGVALFIGVPLPGSGVYTGALGAFVLGLDRRRFYIANVLGVVLAGVVVTAASLLVGHGMVPWLRVILIDQ